MAFAFTQLLLVCTKEMVEVFCKSQVICYQRSHQVILFCLVKSEKDKSYSLGWSRATSPVKAELSQQEAIHHFFLFIIKQICTKADIFIQYTEGILFATHLMLLLVQTT